ncbi:MAG: peptidase, partial [Dietzia cercidiphylli]
MEDETGVRGPAERDVDPDRPLREPAPIHRPVVDEASAERFSRPPGVTGGFDPRRPQAPVDHSAQDRHSGPHRHSGAAGGHDADPALAAAFGPSGDTVGGIERHPGWQDRVEVPQPAPPDPWRDPHAPVGFGTPALQAADEPG